MSITKEAKIVKHKGKWCVIGHKKDEKGKYRNFGCYDSEKKAKERLGQVHRFKRAKTLILNIMTTISDELNSKGIVHIADAIIGCTENVAMEDSSNKTAIKLGKIASLLEGKGKVDLADQIDSIIPEIVSFSEFDGKKVAPKSPGRLPADRAYRMARILKEKYLVGLIDEGSFEHTKMKELETILKAGFLLPQSSSYDNVPEDVSSWWEHFSTRDKK